MQGRPREAGHRLEARCERILLYPLRVAAGNEARGAFSNGTPVTSRYVQ